VVTRVPGSQPRRSPLGLDEDLLVQCVSCGLCLPHCPTYRATEEESASPRGRITIMRAVETGSVEIDHDVVSFMERCVQCRACETACPSGVEFGRLMEQTRQHLASEHRISPWWMRWGLRALRFRGLVLVGSSALGVAQRVHLVPSSVAKRWSLPSRTPIRRVRLRSETDPDAWLFTGCVMDAWQRDVHAAALRVMRATGARVAIPLSTTTAGCCGALQSHAGLVDDARRSAERVIRSFPGDAAIVVDSAGCGAALKDYGHLLDTDDARRFSARVVDIGEWLAERSDELPAGRHLGAVAVADPCHLRHVQRAHLPTRVALARFATVVELDDDGRCCGAGGAYSAMQPELAGQIRSEKIATLRRAGAPVVASANPGCSLWLDAANSGMRIVHPVVLIDEAIAQYGAGRDSIASDV
jgi:glycolate oxidase iron-sulfur subunit